MKLIIDEYKPKKVLIVVGFRKIVEQLEEYFPSTSTFVLSGKDYDHTKQVVLATFQTFNNRNIDLDEFDMIIQDEVHSRQSKATKEITRREGITNILFTGTPLKNNNKLMLDDIDNFIQTVTVKEMLENGWLAPTIFYSNSNIIGENAELLKTKRQDYNEDVVRQLIDKEGLLDSIQQLIEAEHLDTEHNTLIYVNYIETAEQLYKLLADKHNVNIVHSKMSYKEQQEAIDRYHASKGILINVRALSLGFNSPQSDRLIFAIFTKIHSLALQILWRASTVDPNNTNKQSVVYDMTGQLQIVNPFTDFKQYSKKGSCKEECERQHKKDELQKYMCLAGCIADAPMQYCSGELPKALANNPYVSNFKVHKGTPCKEMVPLHQMQYKTVEYPGYQIKWAKCKCGLITSYKLNTLSTVDPEDLVQVYNGTTSKVVNSITCIYDKTEHKAIAIFQDVQQRRLDVYTFNSSAELYSKAVKYFSGRPFYLIANTKLKLPNVTINKALNNLLPLINWNSKNHMSFLRKVIKANLYTLATTLDFKDGIVYYWMKAVRKETIYDVFEFIQKDAISRKDAIKFFSRLEED